MKIALIIPVMMRYQFDKEDLENIAGEFSSISGNKLSFNGEKGFIETDHRTLSFTCYGNGIVVFNYVFEVEDKKAFSHYIELKQNETAYFLNKGSPFIQSLVRIDDLLSDHKLKNNYFYNGKYTSYCLATYYIENGDKDLGYSLCLKREVDSSNFLREQESELNIVNYPQGSSLLLIWGARVFLCASTDEAKEYEKYLEYESEAQQLWFLITSINKKIDNYMKSDEDRAADLSLLLSKAYDVVYSKSRFDTVINSRVHRYELEALGSIVKAGKIDLLESNLEKKIALLKEKSTIISEKIKAKNDKFVNVLLLLISIISSISTIYGFVSVFIADGQEKVTYIIITICAIAVFGTAYLIKFLKDRNKK